MRKLNLSIILLAILSIAAAPSRTYNYTSHTTIDPVQNNANENSLYSYLQSGVDTYASGSITNTAVSSSAAIQYSKLNLIGAITNADISSSAGIVGSKLDLSTPGIIGATSPSPATFTNLTVTGSVFVFGTTHQGDILYDNGSTLVRLTPGTSGQFLKTNGGGANPAWATPTDANTSNVLFQYAASVSLQGTNSNGEVVASTLTNTSTTTNYRYFGVRGTTLTTVWATKWTKIAGVSTVTIYAQLWGNAGSNGSCKVSIGTANGTSGAAGDTSPTWKTWTVDVSGLTNGTNYDVTVQVNGGAAGDNGYLGSLIAFGS